MRVRKNPASVPSLQSGTSSGSITRLASMTVSSTVKPGQVRPHSAHAAMRKPMSNGALWATRTQPSANASRPGRTAASLGAEASIQSVIPVRSSMPCGTGTPGLISEANSPRRRPPRTLTAAISVISAASGDQPVVSRSITANSTSARSSRADAAAGDPRPANARRAGHTSTGSNRADGSPANASPSPLGAREITVGLITETTVEPATDILAAGAPDPLAGTVLTWPCCVLVAA